MKRNFIATSILTIMNVLLVGSPFARAQVGNATITTALCGSNLDLSIFVQRIGANAWNMGSASFVFNYNSAALAFDSILTKGTWDASTSVLYSPLFSAPYGGGNARSLETDNVSTGSGTSVPPSATLVGTLRFRITNFTATHNITWNAAFSAFYDAAGVTQNVTLSPSVDLGVTGAAVVTQPAVYSLSQNYPNPFNPSTVIGFALPKDAHVKLEVYNIIGQKVLTLVDEVRPAGFHSVKLDGTNLASGMYLYRLVAGEQTFTKKLLLVR